MLDLSIFNIQQKKALRFLYEHRGPHRLKEICDYCGSTSLFDMDSLARPEYGRAVKCTASPVWGKIYQITPEGQGIWESLQKQAEDESYQRDYDAKSLEIAEESNQIAQAAKKQAIIANRLSWVAFLASIVSIAVAIWLDFRA